MAFFPCARVTISRPRQRGFSLHELLVTLGIAGGLTATGGGLYSLVQDARLTTEVNQLIADLSLARSEAIKRRNRVVVCPSSDGKQCTPGSGFTWWHRGGLVFVDVNGNGKLDAEESLLRARDASASTIQIKTSASRPRITYHANGMAPGSTITFTFCDTRQSARVRYLVTSNTGRARVSSTPPDGRADEPLERCS